MNYKLIDTERVKFYLMSHPEGVEVADLIAYSGAECLRVYPILFELEQEGRIEVVERELLGAPRVVRLKYRPSTESGQEI